MSKKEVANLACKLLAIYIIVNGLTGGLSGLASVAAILADSQGRMGVSPAKLALMSFGPYIMFIVVGILLWSFSDRIADYVGNQKDFAEAGKFPKTMEEVQVVVFSVLGLFFIGGALPKAVSPIFALLTVNIGLTSQVRYAYIGKLLEAVIQLAFGSWLLLGSHGLVNAIKKLRKAGVEQEPDIESDYKE